MIRSTISAGQKFGHWTTIAFSHKNKDYQFFWHCVCSCGYKSILEQSRLLRKDSTKCRDCANALRRIHKPVQVGEKYGKWFVVKIDEDNKNYVIAQCECGRTKRLFKQSLSYGTSLQCHGCAGRKTATKHGHNCKGKTSPEYRAWCNAKNRVFNPNNDNYGGRGITMCDRWIESFPNFLEDIGLRPSSKHSLERIDNNGDYEPNNVRWALPMEQNKNRSITFKVNGEYINLRLLSKEIKVHPRTIKNLLLKAKFNLEEVHLFSKLSHFQKIEMGKSIKDNRPFTLLELEKITSPVLPSQKRHLLWATWHSIKQRCNNPRNKDYPNYGARGIEVCEEWATFPGFLASILKTIGDKPSSEHQLDRIDNDKHYTLDNIRWATRAEQAKNKQASIVLNGKKISAEELRLKYSIPRQAAIKIARLGWNEEGLQFFSKLSFREKKFLKIFADQLTQEQAIQKHNSLKMVKA